MRLPVSVEDLWMLSSFLDMVGSRTMWSGRQVQEDLVATAEVVRRMPTITCLIGPVKFRDAYKEASTQLSLQGQIALSVGDCCLGDPPVQHSAAEKEALDELHLKKVELADRVLVLNVGGYIGESTMNELRHAFALDKEVDFLEPEVGDDVAVMLLAHLLQKKEGVTNATWSS